MLALKRWAAVGIALGFALLAIVEFFYFPSRAQQAQYAALHMKAKTVAELTAHGIASSLEFEAEDAANEQLAGPARDSELELIVVFSADGKPFAAFDRHAAGLPPAPAVPDHTQTLELSGRLRALTPVPVRSGPPGVLMADFSTLPIERDTRRNRQVAGMIALAILGMGVAMALWLRRAFRRIESLLEENSSARRRAEAANQAKSEILANTSHEIRTPLNAVLGMVEVLLASTELGAKQRHLAETIERAGRTLMALLDDILDFSKIESGKLALEATPFDLHASVEDVVERFAARAHRKGLDLALCVEADVPREVIGDGCRLEQVLGNLIGNAVKFTEQGHVNVRVGVTRSAERRRLRLSVEDTGIGIAADSLGRVFEAFSQADASTTRVYGGTGLGLAISRRLVQMMDGEMGVTSSPGAGSRFWVELPLPSSDHIPGSGQTLQGVTALVLEPNQTCLQGIEAGLAAHGCQVSSTTNVQQARELAEARAPDVLIAAAHPDAEALARDLRERHPELAIVILTAQHDSRPPSTLEAATLLSKPVRRAALVQAVRRASGRAPTLTPNDVSGSPVTNARRARIFAAEDNAANQDVLRAMLELIGCDVQIVENGRLAVEALNGDHGYDLVLMDCQMPVLDGYSAVSEIRENEARSGRRRVPIIALTAHALAGERERVLSAGMDAYMTKPVSIAALRDAVARWAASAPAAGVTQAVPEASGDEAEELLDGATLDVLRSLSTPRKPKFFANLVTKYARDARTYAEAIRSAIEAADREAVRSNAHALKGSSRTVGAKRLATFAEQLEELGRASRPPLDPALSIELELALAKTIGALEAESAPLE